MKLSNLTLPLVASMMTLASSCSVSEPDINTGAEGNDLRLTSISLLNTNYVTVGYDGQGRVTRLTRGKDQMTVKYSPIEIEIREYDGYDDYSDNTPEVTVWKNVTLNSKGYISQATLVYDDGDVATYSFEYDNSGHLVKSVEDGIYPIEFTWDSNGRLTKVFEDEGDGDVFTMSCDYYTTPNTHLQWDPNLPLYTGFVEFTGLMGVPPSYLVKSLTTFSGGYKSTTFYNYRVNDNGWIIQSKMSSDEDFSLPTMTWNYGKK